MTLTYGTALTSDLYYWLPTNVNDRERDSDLLQSIKLQETNTVKAQEACSIEKLSAVMDGLQSHAGSEEAIPKQRLRQIAVTKTKSN